MPGEGHLDGCAFIDENKRNQSTELIEYPFNMMTGTQRQRREIETVI